MEIPVNQLLQLERWADVFKDRQNVSLFSRAHFHASKDDDTLRLCRGLDGSNVFCRIMVTDRNHIQTLRLGFRRDLSR
jgi:hypothetical protein